VGGRGAADDIGPSFWAGTAELSSAEQRRRTTLLIRSSTLHPLWAVLAGSGILGCSTEFHEADPAEVLSVRVDPTEVSLATGPDGGESWKFDAWATYADGTEALLTDAEWTLSNRSAGEIDETGLFTPSSDNGGITWVTARYAGVSGLATATLVYEEVRTEGAASAADFTGTELDADMEMWAYPEDGVNVPRNTPSIAFQWYADPDGDGQSASAWRLRFRSEVTDLTVYTDTPSWTADEETWQVIGSTNAGGQVEVSLAAATPFGVAVADTRVVHINRMDAVGSIFYWSTSASGIMEIPYGGEAEDFLTPETAPYAESGECYACHVVSSKGHIAYTYDGGNGRLGMKEMDGLADVIAYDDAQYANFKSFSPNGQLMLGTYNGALSLYDGVTGAHIMDVGLESSATHVDWSPTGDMVAVVLTDEHSADWVFSGGRIAVMDYLGDWDFGEPRVLYRPEVGNAYYPAFSPDGEWIAFNVSTGDSYDDEDAAVMVMSTSGDAPIALDAANLGEGLTNSWPRWGPLPDDEVLWLAFASKRAYGTVTEGTTPQIWVAGFDPELAREGTDPSWPAFWLPGQDTSQNNHIPVWADRESWE